MEKSNDPVKKALDKMMEEDGIMGYEIRDGKITLFVADETTAKAITVKEIQNLKVEVKVTGKFVALPG